MIEGSPPRVREPLLEPQGIDGQRRITPACAGTTWTWHINCTRFRDHPRVCGNHVPSEVPMEFARGSPPRVREPRRYVDWIEEQGGITPACAGTTINLIRQAVALRDHPRVCGNHSVSEPALLP